MIENGKLSFANRVDSPNQGGALRAPTLLCVHYTAGRDLASSTRWLCNPIAKASAHVIISRDGRVCNQLVSFERVAWACGQSEWGGKQGVNNFSISIELDAEGPCQPTADGRFRAVATGDIIDPANVVHADHKNGGSWKYWTAYPLKQIELLGVVCRDIVSAYPSIKEIVGHDDISPSRKWDPGPCLDLEGLRGLVFGRG